MRKKNKRNKKNNPSSEVWTEEEYDEYMAELYGIEYIAGYTDSGVPYGIPKEQEEVDFMEKTRVCYDDDELPF